MTDDDLAVKEETTEAGQISELKKEIQKLQEKLSLAPTRGMTIFERVLLAGTLLVGWVVIILGYFV